MSATSRAATLMASARAGLGLAIPVTLRTYWPAAASISSRWRRVRDQKLRDVSTHGRHGTGDGPPARSGVRTRRSRRRSNRRCL